MIKHFIFLANSSFFYVLCQVAVKRFCQKQNEKENWKNKADEQKLIQKAPLSEMPCPKSPTG
jgi:hypothetical protein